MSEEIRLISIACLPEHYRRMQEETAMLSGSFNRNFHFQVIVNMGEAALPSLQTQLWSSSWVDLELIGTILGSNRPHIPEKHRGKYHKICKIYRKHLKEYLKSKR